MRKVKKMSIKDEDWFKNAMKKLEETDWESIRQEEKRKFAEGQRRVANREYCNWIEAFLNNLNEPYNDESWAYKTLKHKKDFTEKDIKNEKDLSNFHKFLNIVADIQRIKEYYDDRYFEEYEYVWKFNNKYFEQNTLVGQGSITTISIIDKPDFAVIDLDLYFQREDEGNPMKKYKSSWWDNKSNEDDDYDEFEEDY